MIGMLIAWCIALKEENRNIIIEAEIRQKDIQLSIIYAPQFV